VIVGTASISQIGDRTFRWTASTGYQFLPTLPGRIDHVMEAVSADASTILGDAFGPNGAGLPLRAYLWTQSNGIIDLGALNPAQSTAMHGLSANGSLAVGTSDSRACVWTATTGLIALPGMPPDDVSSATGVSSDGTVIAGHFREASVFRPFRWTEAAGVQTLGTISGVQRLNTKGISGDGSCIFGSAYYSNGQYLPWRWTAVSGMTLVPLPAGQSEGVPSASSSDGSVIVGTHPQGAGNSAFLWSATTGSVNLREYLVSAGATNAAGWTLAGANWISPDGKIIVGTGYRPGGSSLTFEPWIAVIPEPGCPAALLVVCSTFCGRRRRACLSVHLMLDTQL
jgi:uncharacterized membrane protein